LKVSQKTQGKGDMQEEAMEMMILDFSAENPFRLHVAGNYLWLHYHTQVSRNRLLIVEIGENKCVLGHSRAAKWTKTFLQRTYNKK